MCEDMPRFSKVPEREACEAAHVSPLARAALDCGVAFDDVLAYCQGRARAKVLP